MTEVTVNSHIRIPSSRWFFRASRGSGPGGQHVNQTASRVELIFDIENCPELTAAVKERIRSKLTTRINAQGELRLVTHAARSQLKNKEALVARLQSLLSEALKVKKKRKPTRRTKASKEKRLESKKKRSQLKENRRRVIE